MQRQCFRPFVFELQTTLNVEKKRSNFESDHAKILWIQKIIYIRYILIECIPYYNITSTYMRQYIWDIKLDLAHTM